MNRIVLQVPLSQQVKSDAEEVALSQGFSSLQEIVRVFLAKLAQRKIEVTLKESIPLSAKSEKRYLKITKDFQNNQNMYSANNINDLMKQLNENPLS